MTAPKPGIVFLSLLIVFSSFCGNAQNNEADSLKALLSSAATDTMRVYYMYKISDAYSLTQLPVAKKYADSALQLAQTIGYKKGMARSHTRLGNIFNATGEFDTSLAEHLISLKLCEEMKDDIGVAAARNNIALMYTTRSLADDYKHAIEYFKKAKESYEKLKDSAKLTTVLLNIGDAFEKMNRLDSAFYFANKAKQIALKQEDYESLGVIYINLGSISYRSGKIHEALRDMRTGIYYMKASEDHYSLATAWYTLCLCYGKLNKIDSFEFYGNKAITLGDSISNYVTVFEAADTLSRYYAGTGNYASYFKYKELATKKDSVINDNKRTARVEQLKLQEEIRQEAIKAREEAEAKDRIHTVQKVVIAGFIATLFVALFILNRRKANPKAIKALSFICLLLVFEFITFIIHPYVDKLTHHEPIYMVLILAMVAGLLGPLHHRLEHWLLTKLIHKKHPSHQGHAHPALDTPIHDMKTADMHGKKTLKKNEAGHEDKPGTKTVADDQKSLKDANLPGTKENSQPKKNEGHSGQSKPVDKK